MMKAFQDIFLKCSTFCWYLKWHTWPLALSLERQMTPWRWMKRWRHGDTVGGSDIRPTSWYGKFIPLFIGFYISQVVGLGISEPSTVGREKIPSTFVSHIRRIENKNCWPSTSLIYHLMLMNKIPAPIHPHEMLTAKASEAAKKVFEDLLDKVGSLRLFTTFCEKKRQLLFSEIIT